MDVLKQFRGWNQYWTSKLYAYYKTWSDDSYFGCHFCCQFQVNLISHLYLLYLKNEHFLTIDLHHYHYVFCQQFRIMCNQLLPKNVCYKNTLLFFYIWSKGMRFDTADQHSVLVPLTTTHLCSPFNDCFFFILSGQPFSLWTVLSFLVMEQSGIALVTNKVK